MTQYFNMGRRHYLYLAENNILLLSVPEITSVYILLTYVTYFQIINSDHPFFAENATTAKR